MRFRWLAARVALAFASFSVALIIAEILLRILYPAPGRFFYPQEYYSYDAEIGHVLQPLQNAFTHDRPVRTNSLGLRDGELTKAGPETVRVLALGDSQTFGNGLDLSDTWPKQLEGMLRKLQGGPRWEVINAGIPATDTWQHEIVLRRLLDSVTPQAVVLALYVNDVAPRYAPTEPDVSRLTNTWSKRFAYISKRSSVVTWMYNRVLLPWQLRGSGRGVSTEDAVITGENNTAAERGWRQVEQSLALMKDHCEDRNVTFLVAILPRRDQVSGENPARAYNRRALSIGAKHGIAMIDVLPDLSAAHRGRGAQLFIAWDGHNAAPANHVIAERLTATLTSVAMQFARH
jgi:lysophospholipase L1-like esterase